MSQLTARQLDILSLIHHWMRTEGRPPTRSEIAAAFGFKSPNSAEQHLKALERKGALTLSPGRSRGIQLDEQALLSLQMESPPPVSPLNLPVIGRVAAGMPILAQEHIDMFYQVDPHLFRPAANYLLRVQGQSMRDAGILSHDLLAVHQTHRVNQGQIVVVRIEEEVTVKRFHGINDNHLHLSPDNPEFDPMVLDLSRQQVVIEGVVVGVIRNYTETS
ncbi:transcriptional repressor LexA [Thioflexithrix psekupsensis]|uniref:LexA repressor n=1 Tax=Thioflexithrix psekupsensis TaxID=1570016 RepID=A0A251X6D9_9GAMM|nr:transcriptional repressor LexA [Thioflexithrix psekupsensis]OUD13182.1 repressor LexA [Thioflexithrix psekupsensis]